MASGKRKVSFMQKMGLMQLGLFGMGAILLFCALIVKEQRAAVAEGQVAATYAPAAGGGMDGAPGTTAPGHPGTGLPIRSEEIPPPAHDLNHVEPPAPPCAFDGWAGHMVDEAAVKATDRPYRIITPGSAITEDFSPARINVEIDDKRIVTKVWCG